MHDQNVGGVGGGSYTYTRIIDTSQKKLDIENFPSVQSLALLLHTLVSVIYL